MGKQNQDYATMGLKALSRAAQKAIAEAKRKNLKIPIWKDGKIEYIDPEINTEPLGAVDRHSAALQCAKKDCGSSSCCTKDEGRPLGTDVRA